MRETIYFAPVAKSNEIIKGMALFGVNAINLKIMGAVELARYALMKSGISIDEEFVSPREEDVYVADAITNEPYFENASYSDIQNLTQAIKRMRCLVPEDDEESIIEGNLSKGIFKEKNAAILNIYKKYRRYLSDNNSIDSIFLIKKALKESGVIDADFFVLNEYPLNPIEKELLKKLSGDKYTEVCISDLFKADKKPLKIESIKNCYGASNEVETIIDDIYKNKKLDKCTVALTDIGTYAQLFYDYSLLYDIPITFGCGIPIINSNPAKLLSIYYYWITGGFFGRDALNAMINSKALNKEAWRDMLGDVPEDFSWRDFYDILGSLRLTNDEDINAKRVEDFIKSLDEKDDRKQYIKYLEIASKELSLSPEEFILRYSKIRKGAIAKIDAAAVNAIYDELGVIRKSNVIKSSDEIIKNVLGIYICKERSEPGKLHITDIGGALSTPRENLYIAGLSASKYPGSPKENYLLLDEDLRNFGNRAEYLTSTGRIKRKREDLFNLVHLLSDLGSKIYISYAGLNISDLKKDNASSLIYELFKEEVGENATSKDLDEKTEKIDYFLPDISGTREIGKAYNAGKIIKIPDTQINEHMDVSVSLDKYWSPSAINKYLDDPAAFMMTYLLGIDEPEESDPFEIISPMATGILAHLLMETLANSNMKKDDFIKESELVFDKYILANPPLIMENVPAKREEFVEMMESAYDMDPHREVILKEEDIYCEHSSGVKIHGLPDRVEKLNDGSYIIVDFKSGRSVKHEADDINTCLQVVIYAYLMEQKGYNISRGEFRYLRTGDVITCKYDDEMKSALNDILIKFRNALENFNFEPVSDSEELASDD